MSRRVVLVALLAALTPSGSVNAQDWWNAPRYITENADGYFYAIGDLDQDGDRDLVSTVGQFFYPTEYRVFLNDGTGDFSPLSTVTLPATHEFTGVYPGLAEVTGDGRPDLLLRARAGTAYGFAVFPGTGNGQFGAMIFTPLAGSLIDIDVGDNDGDGMLEIAIAHRVSSSSSSDVEVRWLKWNGLAFAPSTAVLIPHAAPSGGVSAVESFDYSGDGLADIVVGTNAATIRELTTLAGQPQSGNPIPIGLSTTSGVRLTKGDFDGDGDIDLLAAGMTVSAGPSGETGHFRVLRFSAGGTFAALPQTNIQDFPDDFDINGCRLADWDGDGRAEMISNTWGTVVGQDYKTSIGVFTLTGGVVKLAWSTRVDGQGHVADIADLNGDGHLDAVSPRSIVFGHGDMAPIGSTQTAVWFNNSLNQPKIAVVDWEDDGDLDILDAEDRIAVNDGTGYLGAPFTSPELFPDTPSMFVYEDAVAIGDFDGDGRSDFLAAYAQLFIFDTIFIEMRLISDDGVGGFLDKGPAAGPGIEITDLGGGGLALPADIDGDGDLDVLGIDGYWPNLGGGIFGAKVLLYQGQPRAANDVDGDGDVDLLVSSVTYPQVDLKLLTQQPGFAFTTTLLLTAELSLYSGDLIDLDGDGDRDVLMGGRNDGAIHLFRNDGASFTHFTLAGADGAGDEFGLDDVDGDGVSDLITASSSGSDSPFGLPRVQVFRRSGGAGSLVFDPARTWVAGGATRIDDVDEDGDLDVIGRAVVKSRRFDGPAAGAVRQYGAGTPGTGGAVPVLGANGPLKPGSTSAAIRLRRGLGGSSALLVVGFGEGSLPMGAQTSLLVQPPLFLLLSVPLAGPSGVAGAGTFDFDVTPATAAAAGFTFYHQVFVVDPAHPLGAAASNGLELVYGL